MQVKWLIVRRKCRVMPNFLAAPSLHPTPLKEQQDCNFSLKFADIRDYVDGELAKPVHTMYTTFLGPTRVWFSCTVHVS